MTRTSEARFESMPTRSLSRREFLGVAATSAAFLAGEPAILAESPSPTVGSKRKIKLGLVGCGGRGSWIGGLFRNHGGYDITSIADYFQPVADRTGDTLGVAPGRRFSGLSGYRRVLESGIEAVALEVPPHFFAEQASAAVDAGIHVYMAKPVAADVPGCLRILEAGRSATQEHLCFRVDYQMPTDPVNVEVVSRIQAGGLGKIVQVATFGICSGFPDPPRTANIESRLQNLVWVNDIAMGCDFIGNFDIHAIDAALWVLGQRPVSAVGFSSIRRPNPHGNSHDVCSVVFEYADGTVHNHFGQALANNTEGDLTCKIFGETASAVLSYWSKSYLRGGPKHFGGGLVENLYQAGAERNIAAFYQDVLDGKCANESVGRSVDGALTTILGREAASRRIQLKMEDLLRENRHIEVDLTGLKA